MSGIYLDNHATTKVNADILKGLVDLLENHEGNASSIEHSHGLYAKKIVDNATEIISDYFGISNRGVIYTSGATEAANMAIQGVIRGQKFDSPKIILSALEHPCVMDTCLGLEKEGLCGVEIVSVDSKGRINLAELEEKALGATLGCFMAAQNEIGNIYPVEKIGKILKKHNCLFFCDATQIIGKHPFSIKKANIDFACFSGHKIHALQGVGCLLINNFDVPLKPLFYGGSQQKGLRPGTYNVPGIYTISEAIKDLKKNEKKYIKELIIKRDEFMALLKAEIPQVVFNGDLENKLPHNIHFSIPGIDNQMVLTQLRDKLSMSTGSACSSGLIQHSRILKELNLPNELIESAFRASINIESKIDDLSNLLSKAIICKV